MVSGEMLLLFPSLFIIVGVPSLAWVVLTLLRLLRINLEASWCTPFAGHCGFFGRSPPHFSLAAL
jgi:hypothetical protein